MRPVRPALVVGSAQSMDGIDVSYCSAHGVDVARRRSGGGAVFVHPDSTLWIDVVVPRGDQLWLDDVGRSMIWLGEAWVGALVEWGVSDLEVHRGALARNDWSSLICFAAVGTGEVVDAHGHKVVGISQRRTRDAARFQCVVNFAWDVDQLAAMMPALAADRPRLAGLAAVVPPIDPTSFANRLAR